MELRVDSLPVALPRHPLVNLSAARVQLKQEPTALKGITQMLERRAALPAHLPALFLSPPVSQLIGPALFHMLDPRPVPVSHSTQEVTASTSAAVTCSRVRPWALSY